VTDIRSNDPNTFILTVNSGSLKITDSVFENIHSPLFLISDAKALMNNIIFTQISCSRSSNSFCLLQATSSESIKISNSSLANVNSNVDLISLSNCSKVLFYNVTVQNILKSTQANSDQIFILNVLNTQSLNISESDFTRIGFSGVKAKNTNLTIENSIFSNRLKTGRLLSHSPNNSIYSAKLSQPIQFIILDTSSSDITGVLFFDNSLNTLVHGGVMTLPVLLNLISP